MTRLLNRNTRYLLQILPVILLICSVAFFFLLKMQVYHLQKEELYLKQKNVLNRFKDENLDTAISVNEEFEIIPVNVPATNEQNIIGDTMMASRTNGSSKPVPFRKLTTYIHRNHKFYQLTTFVSTEETKHLFIMVFTIQGLIYLILLFSIITVNRRLSVVLWKPFYHTLAKLKLYDINANTEIDLDTKTGICEFNELNQATSQLIARIQQAYQSQKQFVENASHEIQTPLAIVRSKVELLMEQPAITDKIAELVSEIAVANNRLSRLNNTLLLLTKIDNRQFIEQENIQLSEIIEFQLSNFEKQYGSNMPSLMKEIQSGVSLVANLVLIEILLNNLIKNSIIHNIRNGYIHIVLTGTLLVIENTGPNLDISPELLFERFRKGNYQEKQSSGLGLALVKHICEIYHYTITYTYIDQLHKLEVNFR